MSFEYIKNDEKEKLDRRLTSHVYFLKFVAWFFQKTGLPDWRPKYV